MLLADYRTAVQDILHDAGNNFFSEAKLNRWINRARQQVAEKSQCVRYMPADTGSITSVAVTGGGSGYTTATVTISAPDAVEGGTQAVATATIGGGQITSISVTVAGSGYVAEPTVAITGDGAAATAMAVVSPHTCTVVGREKYLFTDIDTTAVAETPGLGDIIGIQSVAIAWGSIIPVLDYLDFSGFQAYLRSWSVNYQNRPLVWSQYGQGALGSFYVFPKPSSVVQMRLDIYFSVQALDNTQTVDLIPVPFQEAVYYYAAKLAMENAQRFDDARTMLTEHERLLAQARATSTATRIPTFYPDSY